MPAPRIRDAKTGLKLLEIRRQKFDDAVEKLAGQLGRGDITLVQWRDSMRREIRDLHRTALVIARGGEWDSITQADWGRLGGNLRVQYRTYLDKYANAIQGRAEAALLDQAKPFSEKYLAWRSKLYGNNATASFWRGVVSGRLPQVPRDGQTQCKMNCQCELRVEDGDKPNTLHVYWDLNPAEHCPDCVRLNQEWNPYVLELPDEAVEAAVSLGIDLTEFVRRLLLE